MLILNKIFFSFVLLAQSVNSHAGFELVCKGNSAKSAHKVIAVDCSNRKDFIDKLSGAWQILRRNSIGGSIEDMCWQSFNQARDMHPSISFANISDSFLIRCNMGLAYVK
jgi:hypothetical protein